jgi:opacity protein-like surface antigen
MKRFLFVAAIAFGLCNSAFAADTCAAQADAKKLAGAARTSFTKKCEADSAKPAACEDQATTKKLAGAAKTSFMKKCEADAKAASATPACESQAAEKKLAGAAKNSFVKKCVADAKG